MFGSKKRKEQAQKLLIESSKMITAITNSKELQPLEPGIGAPIYAGCIFIVTSFLRQEKVALEMVPAYESLISSSDITKEQHDYFLNRLNYCYQEIRNTMIEAQNEVGNNDVEILFFAMCDKICDLANIPMKFKAIDILLDYFATFIDRAKLILY